MVIDLNNPEYLKYISDSGNSKDGLIIIDFLKSELVKVAFESIDEQQSNEKIGQDYKSISQSRQYLKKVLKYLIG